ncbi:alpha/beta hydrolase fold domain-containing protein [Mycobacterium yunnanensis]|uniref:Alpha/beta hydrolase fold domain-containing protein n=1 Tax=Mycobacterium yunnanensis TaxID=368477 RepID=A0A9X2Z1T8_9MYCO|nr:alpha/beta hydrolase [Mycobacterium yunnanensis]MCV7422088.1 alpha/beta hydrolase fold domain-containing protein [Mycobacterium yunnanensis]
MSWQMDLVRIYARATRRPRLTSEKAAEAFLARPKETSNPPKWLPRHHDVARRVVDGFDVYTVRPKRTVSRSSSSTGGIIYVHGGAYVSELQHEHWRLIADLADAAETTVTVPIYGLAPDHHAAEASALMQSVLGDVSADGPAYLIGDSSGGGLALASAITWLVNGGPPLSGLTLISPWLDIALRNPDIDTVAPRDPWLARDGARLCGRRWAADLSLDDPRVSPIFGDLHGLPPVDLYIGTDDILMPDCRKLRDALPSGTLTYHEEPAAIHVYPLLPTPEGRAARRELVGNVAAQIS